MKDCNKPIKNSLVRDGTSQSARYPKNLDPNTVKIDGHSEADLINYAYKFASLLNFYNLDNQVDGDWQVFLQKLKENPQAVWNGDLTPQAGLFLAFLRLFKKQQDQLNGLTKKHLDTFFRDVLHISPKNAMADQVHLLFELVKNIDPAKLDAGTRFKAGKDTDGLALFYELTEDIIVNAGIIEELKSVLVDGKNKLAYAGEVPNSIDGLGELELPKDDPKWLAFGKNTFAKANIGFAFASPVLWLQEGVRTIKATLTLRAEDDFSIPNSALQNAFKIYLSGEEEWLGPFTVTPSVKKSGASFLLQFTVELTEVDKAVVYYDREVLDGNFQTIYPVMKVVPDTLSSNYLNAFLQGVVLLNVQLSVEVTGIKTLNLQNNEGTLDAKKAFLPFGSQPVTGSSFQVGYEEAFTKKLDEFIVNVDWLDVPSSNLKSYYSGYSLSSDQFKAHLNYKNKQGQISTKTYDLFNPRNNKGIATFQVNENAFLLAMVPQLLINTRLLYSPKGKITNLLQNKYRLLPGNRLSGKRLFRPAQAQADSPEKGFITFELLDDFLQKDYLKKYVETTVKYKSGDLNLPKEPYQPKVKAISLDYKSSTSKVDLHVTDSDSFTTKEVEFYQLGAFGQREVHGYLLAQKDWLHEKGISLMADYSQEGQLFVGLKNIDKAQTINLLVQVAEGSANPEKDKEPVTWSVMGNNYWYELGADHLLADATNGLLKSGIVKIYLPDVITKDNSWLTEGLVWLRASVKANPDAVCQLIGIHLQAALAKLVEPEKHLSQLQSALEAKTISKMQKPNASIKKIDQPYASFGGRPVEQDQAYYTRVSERLRHKNRAVTIWDYERLVLQEFPQLSKVKCINHTCNTSERAPGHVSLILVPDLQNKNAVNVLQPRVSKAVLENVRDFAMPLAPSLIEIHVSNPSYEEIQLEFEVSFRKSYEYGFYKKQLNQELIDFLSPWATGAATEIHFGGRIEKSVLLKFVETREYVDFVTHFKMYQLTASNSQKIDLEFAVTSNSRAILVSHPLHLIKNYNS